MVLGLCSRGDWNGVRSSACTRLKGSKERTANIGQERATRSEGAKWPTAALDTRRKDAGVCLGSHIAPTSPPSATAGHLLWPLLALHPLPTPPPPLPSYHHCRVMPMSSSSARVPPQALGGIQSHNYFLTALATDRSRLLQTVIYGIASIYILRTAEMGEAASIGVTRIMSYVWMYMHLYMYDLIQTFPRI